jgi:preprotein translocase subunit SecE
VEKMIARLTQYLRETSQEMKRVSWPSIAELKESTVIVLVTVAIITAFIYVVDKILDFAIKQVITLT